MSLFDKELALFAKVARKVNATSAWEMFDKCSGTVNLVT